MTQDSVCSSTIQNASDSSTHESGSYEEIFHRSIKSCPYLQKRENMLPAVHENGIRTLFSFDTKRIESYTYVVSSDIHGKCKL